MDAARELAQLADRELELVDGVGEHLVELGRHVGPEPLLGCAELERERDEPLLGAVVDVPLDPSPLLVPCRHDPGA